MMDNAEVRTRIAPSPTGYFHLGNARAALFNWLFAQKNHGQFILRVEDTDRERSKEEYEIDMEEALTWLGLSWDEGPETPDLHGPYRQSQRLDIYKKYIKQLLDSGYAYHCYCTPEELKKERADQEAKKMPPKYSGKCRNLNPEEIKKFQSEGRKSAVRFKVEPGQKIKFKDLVKGAMEFDSTLISDFIIQKQTGDPIFLLTNIIDDAEMKITHVIRGEDHLPNTPKQIMLAEAMNLITPEYAHLSMILNPDRTKLSKRKNPTSVTRDYRDQGYLPEALINFIAFLGWTPEGRGDGLKAKEFFTLDELVTEFDLSDMGKSPAIFDQAKLDFWNGYYIRQMPLGELAKCCLPYLEKTGLAVDKKSVANGEQILSAISLVQERMKKLSEAPELTSFFFEKPKYSSELLIPKKSSRDITIKALTEAHQVLSEENDFGCDSIEQLLRALANKLNISAGEVLWPVRVSLSGRDASPGAFELISFFGKEETLARIKTAIEKLKL